MSHPDFSAVHLLPEEEAALRRYAALDQIPEDAPYLKTFRRYGFLSRVDTVQDDMGFPGGCRLIVSDHGRRFLHYLEDKDKIASGKQSEDYDKVADLYKKVSDAYKLF